MIISLTHRGSGCLSCRALMTRPQNANSPVEAPEGGLEDGCDAGPQREILARAVRHWGSEGQRTRIPALASMGRSGPVQLMVRHPTRQCSLLTRVLRRFLQGTIWLSRSCSYCQRVGLVVWLSSLGTLPIPSMRADARDAFPAQSRGAEG